MSVTASIEDLRGELRRLGRGGRRVQRRRRLVAAGQGGTRHPRSLSGSVRNGAVAVVGRSGGGGLSRPGRRVGPALGGRPTDEMHDPAYVANGADRCAALQDGPHGGAGAVGRREDATVVLGVNVSDLGDHRPGQAAAAGAGARLPLRRGRVHQGRHPHLVADAGPAHLGQTRCRLPGLSPALRHAGDAGAPGAVESAEAALRALGFGQLRVRHHGEAARLEVEPAALEEVMARRDEVVAAVRRRRLHFRGAGPRGFPLGQPEPGAAGRGGSAMSAVRVKVKLTFPESEVRRPVLAIMVRQFDVEPNIRRADVEEHRGWIVCEVDGEAAQVEAALELAPRRGDHGRSAGRRPRGLSCHLISPRRPPAAPGSALVGVLRHVPAGRGHLAGLVENTALGAGEGKGLVGVHLAAFEAVPLRRRPHHVVAAILVDRHAPFWRSRRPAVASPPVDPTDDHAVPLKTLLRWSESLSGHRAHGPRVHREPVRAGTLRGDPQGRRRHPFRG